jgi:hypothetical protein
VLVVVAMVVTVVVANILEFAVWQNKLINSDILLLFSAQLGLHAVVAVVAVVVASVFAAAFSTFFFVAFFSDTKSIPNLHIRSYIASHLVYLIKGLITIILIKIAKLLAITAPN